MNKSQVSFEFIFAIGIVVLIFTFFFILMMNKSNDISKIFSTFYKGNYHPLTTLFYAVEYNLFKDDAKPCHFINLLFHLLNVLLVFIFLTIL